MIQDLSDNVSHFLLIMMFLIVIKPATRNGVLLRSSELLCLNIKLEVPFCSGNALQGDYLKK